MTYAAKEIFLTVQGEGGQAGRPAVFLRFAGCNLWNGLERDRAAAVCSFCDTDFVGWTATAAASSRPRICWPTMSRQCGGAARAIRKLVVCTGGEPLLQLDPPLIEALHARGFEIAIESNGTLAAPAGIDWICVSPKADAPVVQTAGQELKLVFPRRRPCPTASRRSISSASGCSPWTAPTRPPTRPRPSNIA
jgi:7-carboxy-7-deazaguanine synthase